MGDLNVDLHKKRNTSYELVVQSYLTEPLTSIYPNLFENQNTFFRTNTNPTSIDIMATNAGESLRIDEKYMDYDHKISDHITTIFSLDVCNFKAKKSPIEFKPKIKDTDVELVEKLNRNLSVEIFKLKNQNNFTPTTATKAMELIAKDMMPIRKFTPKTAYMKAKKHPDIISILKERSRWMTQINANSIAEAMANDKETAEKFRKRLNNKITSIRKNFLRRGVKGGSDIQSLWQQLKNFRNIEDNWPDFVTPNRLLKFFKKLSWDYTPLELR